MKADAIFSPAPRETAINLEFTVAEASTTSSDACPSAHRISLLDPRIDAFQAHKYADGYRIFPEELPIETGWARQKAIAESNGNHSRP